MTESGSSEDLGRIAEIIRSVGLALLLCFFGGYLLMSRGCDDPNSCRCPCHKRQDIEKMTEALENRR